MKIDYLISYHLIVQDVLLEYFVKVPLMVVVEEDIDRLVVIICLQHSVTHTP